MKLRTTATSLSLALAAFLVACLVASLGALVPGAPPAAAADPCLTGPAAVGRANTVATGNPLDNAAWAVGYGNLEDPWIAYCNPKNTATQKALLGKIALRPRMLWFGHWFKTDRVRETLRTYIAKAQDGHPERLVQLGVFRVWPRGEGGRDIPLTRFEQEDYRAWVRNAAAAIGKSRVAIVLEPDLGIAAYDSADPGVRLGLARYAARVFSALPRTNVYIDASASDWLRVDQAVLMLRRAGITYTRGFALGATHYAKLPQEIDYARRVSRALAAAGFPGRKAIIDTSDNVRGFTYHEYYAEHPKGWFDNAEVCRSRTDTSCVTLGVRPTWRVGAGWGLSETMRATARRYVDAYTWFSRPWLYAQATPFLKDRALQLARTTPY